MQIELGNHRPSLVIYKYLKLGILYIYTCAYSTTENTNFVKWCFRIDLCNTSSMNHCVLTECRGAHEMVYGLSIDRESRLVIIEHDTSVSVDPKKITHVALLWLTMWTFTTLPCEYRQGFIPWFQMSHTFTYALHDPDKHHSFTLHTKLLIH